MSMIKRFAATAALLAGTAMLSGCYCAPAPGYAYSAPGYAYGAPGYAYSAPGYYAAPSAPYGYGAFSFDYYGGHGHRRGW